MHFSRGKVNSVRPYIIDNKLTKGVLPYAPTRKNLMHHHHRKSIRLLDYKPPGGLKPPGGWIIRGNH